MGRWITIYAVFNDVLSVKEKLITHYNEDGSVDTGKVSDDGKMISWCVPGRVRVPASCHACACT